MLLIDRPAGSRASGQKLQLIEVQGNPGGTGGLKSGLGGAAVNRQGFFSSAFYI